MIGRIALYGLASLPLWAFGMVVALACFSLRVTGRWPRYAQPDPKSLPAGAYWDLCVASVLGALGALVVYPVVAVIVSVRSAGRGDCGAQRHRGHVLVFIAGVLAWVMETSIRGRAGLLNWIFD